MPRTLLTILGIIAIALLYTRCTENAGKVEKDPRGTAYAGAASCASCHQQVAGNYLHTAHANTSWDGHGNWPVPLDSSAAYQYDSTTSVVVEQRDSGTYQVAYTGSSEVLARGFDIGFGSGEKAFSFGFWQDGTIFQLPLSYFRSIGGWANSPGFPAAGPNFKRVIIRRCFECHSSYIAEQARQEERLSTDRLLNRKSLVYGIDCERCHGPAAAHVDFHTGSPRDTIARHITRWVNLSRQQQLDACAVCHSGNDLDTRRTTFSFRPGDTLRSFYYPEFASQKNTGSDVHGKQLQLLEASACFRGNNRLQCASCHDAHQPAAPTLAGYSGQCAGCHQSVKHPAGLFASVSPATMVSNCIDCHMPEQASRLISFQAAAKQPPNAYLLRTHRIAVYPEATELFIKKLKEQITIHDKQ